MVDLSRVTVLNGVQVESFGPEDAMAKRPKDLPIEPSEWDRHVAGVTRQMRLDIFVDDIVSLSKQADILMEFARRMKLSTQKRDLTVGQIISEIRGYHFAARILIEDASPSQVNRTTARRERLRREGR